MCEKKLDIDVLDNKAIGASDIEIVDNEMQLFLFFAKQS